MNKVNYLRNAKIECLLSTINNGARNKRRMRCSVAGRSHHGGRIHYEEEERKQDESKQTLWFVDTF